MVTPRAGRLPRALSGPLPPAARSRRDAGNDSQDGVKFRFTDKQGVDAPRQCRAGRSPLGRIGRIVAEVSFSAVRWISEQSMPSRA